MAFTSSLRRGDTVIDDTNYRKLLAHREDQIRTKTGSIEVVGVHIQGGERRLLAAKPKPINHVTRPERLFAKSGIKKVPRSDWPAMLEEQIKQGRTVSQRQNFAPHDQNGLPTCWANGPAHAYTTLRYFMGLPLKYISACSAAVPISGGHSGGWELEATEYWIEHGAATTDVWSNNATNRGLMGDAGVVASRKLNHPFEIYECDDDDEFASVCLAGKPCAISYNWWSHVVMLCDLVLIEPGSWGFRIRNNWGDWGDKNDHGFYGYQVLRFGKGSPSSGHAYSSIQPSW